MIDVRSAPRVSTPIVMFVLAACAAPTESESSSQLASAIPSVAAASVAPSPDLAEVIISGDDPPTGLSLDYTEEGPSALTRVVISGRDAEFQALEGFADGRFNGFSGDVGVLLSLGLAFDTVDHAGTAFDLYLDELQSNEGYGFATSAVSLGDEGYCAEGDNPGLGGLHEAICLWRNGQLVLMSGGTLDAEAIFSAAEGMDERADAATD